MFKNPPGRPPGNFSRRQNPHLPCKKIAAKPWPSGQEVTCREAQKPHPGQKRTQALAETVRITQKFDEILFLK